MILKSINVSEYSRFKILSDDSEITKGDIDSPEITINIPKDYYGKRLKLIIDNRVFTGEVKYIFFVTILYWIVAMFGGSDEGCLGTPIKYIARFTIVDETTLVFDKKKVEFFEFEDNNITYLSCQRIVERKEYNRWLYSTFIPIEIIILFLATVVAGVFNKYWMIIVSVYAIIHIIAYYYINRIRKLIE